MIKTEAKDNIIFQNQNVDDLLSTLIFLRQNRHEFLTHLTVIMNISTEIEVKNYITDVYNLQFEPNRKKYCDIHLLNMLLSEKSSFAESKNIKFSAKIDEKYFEHISISSAEMVSVISNLIGNAFDACENLSDSVEKNVRIEMYQDNDDYFIKVSNSGKRIAENVLNSIFLSGFSTKNAQRGFGLSIVKKILDKNGGTIKVNSDENKTEFIVKMPILI